MPVIARCLDCGYILNGLPEPRCPECGREFDPADSRTVSFLPRFIRWKYWLPGFIFAVGSSAIIFAALFYWVGVGWAVTIVTPFCFGGVMGYGCSTRGFFLGMLIVLGLGLVSGILIAAQVQGLFCGLVLVALALGPLVIGAVFGLLLRVILKRSRFSQAWHLPILLFFLLLPLGVGAVERQITRRFAPISIVTSTVMDAPPEKVWNSVIFYEQVKHSPPLLLRLGLSYPIYSYGKIEKVGDEKTCVYDQGKLVKRITRIEQGKLIEFDVVHQSIERCACRLKRGSFRFEPDGEGRTRVTLTTEYEPFLTPRFAWGPWEEASAHTLHRHVLLGMSMKAAEPDKRAREMGDRK